MLMPHYALDRRPSMQFKEHTNGEQKGLGSIGFASGYARVCK